MPNEQNPSALDELMEARERATKGEWHIEDPMGDIELSIVVGDAAYEWCFVASANRDGQPAAEVEANAKFICLAHTLLPAIREEVERLREIKHKVAEYLEAVDVRRAAQKAGFGAGYANSVALITKTESALRNLLLEDKTDEL